MPILICVRFQNVLQNLCDHNLQKSGTEKQRSASVSSAGSTPQTVSSNPPRVQLLLHHRVVPRGCQRSQPDSRIPDIHQREESWQRPGTGVLQSQDCQQTRQVNKFLKRHMISRPKKTDLNFRIVRKSCVSEHFRTNSEVQIRFLSTDQWVLLIFYDLL